MGDDENILVGEITAPFGIQGEVKLIPYLDDPALLTKMAFQLRLADGTRQQARAVRVRPHQGVQLLLLENMDRTTAEALRGASLFLKKSEFPALSEGSYYQWQLKGLQVETDTGRVLGTIKAIHFNPLANDVYETELALIPAHEQFVLSVNLETHQMVVRDDPGLLKNHAD